ncbi:hypothetical protein BN2537_6871 [Streptomyces venezuelae]|nr:hypothetical protein BN2537_6871 [Streptomyces venezuelae]
MASVRCIEVGQRLYVAPRVRSSNTSTGHLALVARAPSRIRPSLVTSGTSYPSASATYTASYAVRLGAGVDDHSPRLPRSTVTAPASPAS